LTVSRPGTERSNPSPSSAESGANREVKIDGGIGVLRNPITAASW
jgi:hypothetical protein